MKKLLLIPIVGISMLSSASAYDLDYIKKEVTLQAQKYNVPAKFAHAIVTVESSYNPKALGSNGEIGLGQISCRTAKSIGFVGSCERLYDPSTNLKYTMIYLRKALDITNDNQCYAATLYSSGLGRSPSSSDFCKKVITAYQKI